MATVKIEIQLFADGELADEMENALEGGIAEDLAPAAARCFRNDLADYLRVPLTHIQVLWGVLE